MINVMVVSIAVLLGGWIQQAAREQSSVSHNPNSIGLALNLESAAHLLIDCLAIQTSLTRVPMRRPGYHDGSAGRRTRTNLAAARMNRRLFMAHLPAGYTGEFKFAVRT